MFQDIRRATVLAAISGQASEPVGHLTGGLNYADANIDHTSYDNAVYIWGSTPPDGFHGNFSPSNAAQTFVPSNSADVASWWIIVDS